MARTIGRLNALKVGRLAKTAKRGLTADGGGLYLQVDRSGVSSWIFRFMIGRRARSMGLGAVHTISLADARQAAADCRRQRHGGIDPIEARNALRTGARLAAAKAKTFDECRDEFLASHEAGWRNAKHAAQWKATLTAYVTPVFGKASVQDIDTAAVMKALEPIWKAKPETAGRVRGRIERVLDFAAAHGLRVGENPARWRGHLDKLLPPRSKVRRVVHHAALPYADIPEFMQALQAQEGFAARALEFTILTAARTGETIGATWGELDLAEKVWTIPGERMKAGKEHRAPLAGRALAIVESMRPHQGPGNRFLFPGGKHGKPLSNMAMAALLERMGRDTITVHGFRSTFRDWAAEQTNVPNQVVEMSLAHAIGDKVEAAYRRGDLMEKRRRLMEDWDRFCDPNDLLGNVPVAARAADE